MAEKFSDVLCLDVSCDPRAPSVVREALDGVAEIGAVRNEARLIASELTANAVLHSGCSADDVIEVRASVSDDRLLISVHDPGASGQDAEPRSGGDPIRGGFGLRLVQQLARRWGTERPDGHRVWAELALQR